MKITRIRLYRADLPLAEGRYAFAAQEFTAFDTTVVLVETDQGLTGAGETCPLGPAYLAAHAEGARAAIQMMAPALIGRDPRDTDVIASVMDATLRGHPYAKSALDMACWDLAGQAMGQPVWRLLGGRAQQRVRLYHVVSRADPAEMVAHLMDYQARGFTHFQVKVGEDPDLDIERMRRCAEAMRPGEVMNADANTGWTQADAIRVARAVNPLGAAHGIRIFFEQPCFSYEECLAVRPHVEHPFVLDECMDGLPALLRGHGDRAMDAINLKINRFGGLTRARQIRDLCVSLGLMMNVEDSWGGEIATAAIAHLAASTPARFHFQSSAFHTYHTRAIASGAPEVDGAWMTPSDRPGLGITPDISALGAPVWES